MPFYQKVELLTQTTLRNIIAQMTLDDTFSSRELINVKPLILVYFCEN